MLKITSPALVAFFALIFSVPSIGATASIQNCSKHNVQVNFYDNHSKRHRVTTVERATNSGCEGRANQKNISLPHVDSEDQKVTVYIDKKGGGKILARCEIVYDIGNTFGVMINGDPGFSSDNICCNQAATPLCSQR